MDKLTGKKLAEFALSKLGTPYVYGAKGSDGIFTQLKLDWLSMNYPKMFTPIYKAKAKKIVGKVACDCSGLISWYTGKSLGSAQLYSSASKRGLIKDIEKAPIGAILWHEGHVGVYIGDRYCVEEKGIDYGCVKSKITNTRFTHWLLFDYIEYEETKEPIAFSKKKKNPYDKPSTIVTKGMKGESVKWVQFELAESGYPIAIDGDFRKNTLKYVKLFQQSSKLVADGEVGIKTVKALLNDQGK